MILAGEVLVDEVPITKSGTMVQEKVLVRIRSERRRYVSRSAEKLLAGLQAFSLRDLRGRVGLDVGASTGGFTEVLLEAGCSRVYALDVGHQQLDWKIRNNSRVIVMEKFNARALEPKDLPEKVSVVVMDVSFISIKKVLAPTLSVTEDECDWVLLVKPQFEVGREKVGAGGIVREESDRIQAVRSIQLHAQGLGLLSCGEIPSPILGSHGNQEYLLHFRREK
jgi:23S rRNA (cytidine1920-2'-O)/16S rRNA (cytidine1409-2'-O)-methyltransferase